ncbi:nitrate/nitrite transporter NrtS [Devosia algicola]|uniref:Nitrate/nitrite transporter NrtS n=1 Tax=Devosia algicola TaxID=3026418 RepID=A0ABY7YQA6_9HYPH|nr:nitrate/nitrite transporter NrtS [Devosia algicola]WDR03500.1 nitrate/nitrite transporter NrtS [Devosia algicola]
MVALVVGSLLSVINQGDAVLAGQPINLLKVTPTFAVPFLVATFGAWSVARSIARTAA